MNSLTIKQMFERLDAQRSSMLERNREYAELSIPSILPKEGTCESSELPVPFSSACARGCTRLASRLAGTLVPLNNMPFFNIEIDDADPVQGEDPTEEQKILSRLERRVMRKLQTTNFRSSLYLTIQHCEVVGNGLIVENDDYSFAVHRLDNYVIRRRPDGEWHEIILRTWVDPAAPPTILLNNGIQANSDDETYYHNSRDPKFALYTRVVSNHKGGCTVTHEYQGKKLEVGSGEEDVCRYFPVRWNLIAGENYGRGLIEDNCGDVRAIDIMAEALLDSIVANAEYRFGVNPAGITEIHDLQSSLNGKFVPAAEGDVFPIQLGNQAQVAAAQQSVTLKEQVLGQIFLLNSAIQPQGDRVTATQVRLLATELEQALGGVFSDAARELLIPVVRRTMYQMLRDGILIPDDDPTAQELMDELKKPDALLNIRIRTGLEALNREVENEKLKGIMETALRLPEPGQEAIEWVGLINRWISTEGLEPAGIVKSVQQVEQERQLALQVQTQQSAIQRGIQSAGTMIEQTGVS